MSLSAATPVLERWTANHIENPPWERYDGPDYGLALEDLRDLRRSPDARREYRLANGQLVRIRAARWEVKDYADGWISFNHEPSALAEADAMGGALVRRV